MKRLFPALCLVSCLIAAHSFAGSATWSANAVSGDWDTLTNWTPMTIPSGPNDTATFATSDIVDIYLSSNIELNGMTFNLSPTAYSIAIGESLALTLSGVGIVDNGYSGLKPVVIAKGSTIRGGSGGQIFIGGMNGTVSSGDATLIAESGSNGGAGGEITFGVSGDGAI